MSLAVPRSSATLRDPALQLEAWTLRDNEELTQQEIADELEITVNQAKVLIRRGRNRGQLQAIQARVAK